MRKYLIWLAALVAVLSCDRTVVSPRPTIPLVHAIVADSAGVSRLVAQAGRRGAEGSIAIIGEPAGAVILARRFQSCDHVDNVDGRPVRDSLPDFAGEAFDVIMDACNAPYSRFWREAEYLPDSLQYTILDSLREVAVENAVSAWDSLSWRAVTDPQPLLLKQRAKMLIYTSSLQTRWGLFDVDTLQQLCGGQSLILSPVRTLLDDAYAAGARDLVVWASRDVRLSGVWQEFFQAGDYPDARLTVLTPDAALDVRTQLRSLLRQYRSSGNKMDALLLDSYTVDTAPLLSELALIRFEGTEEDAAFQAMLSPSFAIWDPVSSLIRTTYHYLRDNHLFTHRIARPQVHYYETVESDEGNPVLVETTAAYAVNTYVPHLN